MQKTPFLFVVALMPVPANAARLNMALVGPGGALPPDMLRMDIVWTTNATDTPATDLDAIDARFNVRYPPEANGELRVTSVTSLPGWNTEPTMGIGDRFEERFFLGTGDESGMGIPANGTEFSTLIASIFLRMEGNVVGTEVSFRHNSPNDPLPAPHDGPRDWQLRWQAAVNGPLQFDIGVGNPGDAGGNWTNHGYEAYQPLIIPETGSLVVWALAGLDWSRRSRSPEGA